METIKINNIEKKFTKPDEKGICTPFWTIVLSDKRKVTIWDNQFADYIEKDVGIGGSCKVEIKETDSGYLNIRAVDMTSAVKREVDMGYGQEFADEKPKPSDREKSIIAQCLTKIVYRNATPPRGEDVLETYNYFLKELA